MLTKELVYFVNYLVNLIKKGLCSLGKSSVIPKIKVCQNSLAKLKVRSITNVLKLKQTISEIKIEMCLQKWFQPYVVAFLILSFFWLSSFYSHGKWFECLMGHFIGKWTIVMKLPNTQCVHMKWSYIYIFFSLIKLRFWIELKHIYVR